MREELLLEYTYLADGETAAGQMCPACQGGSSGERTLSVSRQGGSLLWNCHRASCTFAGREHARSYRGDEQRTRVPPARGVAGRAYYRNAEPLPDEINSLLREKYGFDSVQISELAWDVKTERVVIPVYNQWGELEGSVLRSESGASPKALSYTEEDAIAVFSHPSSRKVIVVEDAYSALRASKYMTGVALLGTHLNVERVEAIKDIRAEQVKLALDADMAHKTIKYVRQYRNVLPMHPVLLSKDLKNMNEEELVGALA